MAIQLRKEQTKVWLARAWTHAGGNTSADCSRAARQYFCTLLVSLGVLLSAYVVGTYGWMYHQQRALLHQWQIANARPLSKPLFTNEPPLTRILIPKIKLDAIITEGVSHRALTLGPGHLQYSAIPGEVGNSVVAGHRDTFFRHIYELKTGDDIYVERQGKEFHYVVTGKRVVEPTDLSVLDNSPKPRLTLITCYPVNYIGPAPERLVVVAELAKQG